MDFLIEFEDRAPEWIRWSANLDASVPYGEYVMRERPLFLLRTKKALADKQRADEEHLFDHYEVECYWTVKSLTNTMILIDDAYAKAHPSAIPEELRTKVLRRIG